MITKIKSIWRCSRNYPLHRALVTAERLLLDPPKANTSDYIDGVRDTIKLIRAAYNLT